MHFDTLRAPHTERASRAQTLTLSLENEAPVSSLPGHLFKSHQGGVNTETLTTLPNSVCVTGADARHQGH